MKRILTALALALAAATSFGATLNPIQLLSPVGSAIGQSIVSTGPSSAPVWSTSTLPSIKLFDPLCGVGTHDCKPAIDAAITAAKGGVMFPPGIYYDSGNHTISGASGASFQMVGSGQSTYGVGSFSGQGTLIVETTAANPFVVVAAATNWVTFAHFTLTRNVTATSGGNGITFAGDTEFSLLDDLLIDSQFQGVSLKTTTWSNINRLVVQNSQADGIAMTNLSTVAQVQWQLNHIISGNNVGRGINAFATTGQPGMIFGAWNDIATFQNTQGGIAIGGLAGTPADGLRINGCFIGSDGGQAELAIVNAQSAMISFCSIERAGLDPTGPGSATAAGHTGHGISIDANSNLVKIWDSYINNNSYSGIFSSGTNVSIVGVHSENNGQAAAGASLQQGITINAGNASIIGSQSDNEIGNTSQLIGVGNSGTINAMTGNALLNNTNANFSGTVPNGAGNVPQVLTASAGPTSLSSSTSTNIATLTLPVGEWDISGVCDVAPAGSTVVGQTYCSVGTVSAALGSVGQYARMPYVGQAGVGLDLPSPPLQVSVASGTTTVYLVMNSTFTVSTANYNALLRARRVP